LRRKAKSKSSLNRDEKASLSVVERYRSLADYRCPTVFCDYAVAGSDAPRAAQGTGYNTSRRIAGCLDAYTGRLI